MIVYLYAVVLTLVNLVLWFGILFNLPGAWLMILLAALVEGWAPGELMFSWRVLYIAAGIALVGEILEFVLGAAGSRHRCSADALPSLSATAPQALRDRSATAPRPLRTVPAAVLA